MRKKALLLSALFSVALCACNHQVRNTEVETAASEEPARASSPGIELTTAGPPSSVAGCSCLLAENAAQYRDQQFLYAEKYGVPPPGDDFAFIFIAGEPVRLTIQDSRIDNEARTRKKVYAGDDYRVTVDLQAIQRPDHEVWVQTGTLTVETEQGETVVKDVYGVCGC
ncbi:MAG: hypothetical protein R6V61_11855 [Wenzhouxiangellaceae bacterium]